MYGVHRDSTCSPQGGIGRVTGSSSRSLVFCVLLVEMFGSWAVAQTTSRPELSDESSAQTIPLGSIISDDLLSFAKSTSALARKDEGLQHYLDAALKYESILAEAGKTAVPANPVAVYMMKAAAHIDAARTRFSYASTLTDSPKLYESNRAAISDHLSGAQKELHASQFGRTSTLGRQVFKLGAFTGWDCEGPKLNAQSYYLQGMLNHTAGDLDESIRQYQAVANCDPAVKAKVENLTAYIARVRANMAHSPQSGSEIMKASQQGCTCWG